MTSKDEWTMSQVEEPDGRVRFFLKNTAPSREPGDPAYPYLAYVTFRYSDADDRGLPSGEDWKTVKDIENSAATPLEADDVAIHVAEVLGHGVKDLLFYVRDVGTFTQRTTQLLHAYATLSPSVQICLDAAWSQYDDFP